VSVLVSLRWAAYWLALVFTSMGISASVVSHPENAAVCLCVGVPAGVVALVLFGVERGWWR
jgi:hypothetical protein